MTLFRFALPALIAGLTCMAAAADEKPPAQRYQACLSEVEKFPKDAFEDAIQWGREGGGGPAEHCAASALMALGLHADAAKRLEALAQSVKEGPGSRPTSWPRPARLGCWQTTPPGPRRWRRRPSN